MAMPTVECSWCFDDCGGAGAAGVFTCDQCGANWHERHFEEARAPVQCLLCAPPRTGYPGKNKSCHWCKNIALPSASHGVWLCPTPRCPFVFHMRHFRNGLEPSCLRCDKKCCCAFPGCHSDDTDHCCSPEGERLISCASCMDRRTRKKSRKVKEEATQKPQKPTVQTPPSTTSDDGAGASNFAPTLLPNFGAEGDEEQELIVPVSDMRFSHMGHAEQAEALGEGAGANQHGLHDQGILAQPMAAMFQNPFANTVQVLEMRQAAMVGVVQNWQENVLEYPLNNLRPEHVTSAIAGIMNSDQLANIAAMAYPGNVLHIINAVKPVIHKTSEGGGVHSEGGVQELCFSVTEATEAELTGAFAPTIIYIDGFNFNEKVVSNSLFVLGRLVCYRSPDALLFHPSADYWRASVHRVEDSASPVVADALLLPAARIPSGLHLHLHKGRHVVDSLADVLRAAVQPAPREGGNFESDHAAVRCWWI